MFMKIMKTLKITLLGIALLAISLANSQAQTAATWIGPVSGGEWNTGANWDTTAPPLDATTNAIVGAVNNINYNLPMAVSSFGVLTNNGTLNVNTNGFNCSAIVMVSPNGTGKIFVNTGAVINVTGNFGFMSNAVVNMSVGSSVTIGGTLYVGCGTNNGGGGGGGGTPSCLGAMTNNGGALTAAGLGLNSPNGSVGNGLANLFVINGGTNNLGSVYVGRASGATQVGLGLEGLVINGGFVNMTSLLIGNNAWGAMLVRPGATVTNTGDGRIRMIATTARPARMYQTGGLYVTAGTNYLSPTNAAAAVVAFSVTGGTNYSTGFQFGELINTGTVNFTNGAVMYLGSGGIGSNGVVTINAALNNGGLFGATADWTSFSPLILNGVGTTFTFQAADADGTAHNITLAGGGLRGTGSLNKVGAGILTLNAPNTYSGNTLINFGTLAMGPSGSNTSPLTIVGSGTTFDVSAVTGGFVLSAAQTLSGSGSVNGTVTTPATIGLPAPTINPGSNTLTGTLTLLNDLVEQGGAINHFDLSGNPLGTGNDFLHVTGALTVSGTNVIEIGLAPQNGGVYKLIQYGTFSGSLANFSTLSGTLSNNVANKIIYLIAQSNNHAPTNMVWLGNALTNNWDMLITSNWSIAGTGPSTNFVTGDDAHFNNVGAANSLVNIVGGVTPGSVTVDSTSDYTFTGLGSIAGISGLTKTNSGRLIILNTNTYTGPTVINGGILVVPYLANGSSASSIGAANSDPANLVISNGTLSYFGPSVSIDRGITLATNFGGILDITNGTTLTENGPLGGGGGLVKAGPGTLILATANSYSGPTTLSNGVLRINSTIAALANTVVFAGGTLSLNISAQQTFLNPLDVATTGTLISSGGNNNVLQGAWSGSGTLSMTETTGGFITINADMTTNFTGTILMTDTSAGQLRFNGGGGPTGPQASSGSATATFDLGNSYVVLLNRNGGGTNYGNYYLGALAGGPGTYLRGSANSGSPSTYVIGDKNLSTVFSGTIQDGYANAGSPQASAAVSIVKTGTGSLTLNGSTNNFVVTINDDGSTSTNYFPGNGLVYTGSTTISNGVLALIVPASPTNSSAVTLAGASAVLDATQMGYLDGSLNLVTNGFLEVISGKTLAGIGTILASNIVADAGSILSPGLPVGTLNAGQKIEIAGQVGMSINAAATPNCSKIVSPVITVDGSASLTVTNIGLEGGATFQLFNHPVNFTSVILPTPSGTNIWQNNLAANGSITLLAPALVLVNTNATSITNSFNPATRQLTLEWPLDHTGYHLQVQTNSVAVGISNNWFEVAGSTATNKMIITIDPSKGSLFYRIIYP